MTTPTIITRIKFEGLDDIKVAFEDMRKSWKTTTESMTKAGAKVGDGLKKGLAQATAAAKLTGTVGVRSFTLMTGALGRFVGLLRNGVSMLVRLGQTAVSVAGKVAAVGTATFAAVSAFGVQTGKGIDEIGRMARTAGVPIERFSRLAAHTRLLGGEVENLSEGLKTLSERVTEAAKDSESTGGKAFAQLGIDIRDANGNLKSTEAILDEVANAMEKIPSATLRAASAAELFGGDARYILPMLEDGAEGLRKFGKEADKYGTVVTESQSKAARAMLVEFRKVGEAARGISYRVVEGLLPMIADSSSRLSGFLVDNSDRITRFTSKVLSEVNGVAEDFGKALFNQGIGIERGWVRKVIPAITTAKDVFLDLLDMMTGGGASRTRWLREVSKLLDAAAGAAGALATAFGRAAGLGETKLPSLTEAIIAARMAFESLHLGIEGKGGEASMPWAAGVGEILGGIASAAGGLAAIVAQNKESILSFLAQVPVVAGDGVAAVKALMSGEQIGADNMFEFLNGWKAKWDEWVGWAKLKWDEYSSAAQAAYAKLEPILTAMWGLFDTLAQALGFGSGLEAAFAVVIAKVTGLDKALGLVWSIGKKIGGWLLKIAKSTAFAWLAKGAAALAAALGLPVAAVAAIVAAVAAAVIAIWYYWDEIKAGAKATWDGIVFLWDAFADWIGGVFAAAWEKVAEFWEDLKAAPGEAWDALKAKWQGLKDWIGSVFDGARQRVSAFWDSVAAMPGRAWDSLVSVWSGFTGFFSGMIDRVKGWFRGLWDGVKNGARDAWSSVKGWFGFGEDEAASGTADKSPKLATGGIIRGPGSGVSDSIRAWLSNGEGVLNAKAVAHYGEGLVHALNSLLVPKTHFASGGIVGQMVPAASGVGLGALHLAIDGRSARGGMYADADAMRMLRRDFRVSATASRGRLPRWRGA